MEKQKILILDGHNLVYRAFYALPTTLTTSTGLLVNAVYGFTSMLIKLLEEERPQGIAVAFDRGYSKRDQISAQYKAHRLPSPDGLRPQFPLVKEVLNALQIPILEIEGYEADDLLAAVTKKLLEYEETEIELVTGDRDAFQLISPRVKIIASRKGITDIVRYDLDRLNERYGLRPGQIADFIALKGDTSDNIPGIPGIGDKTASALLQKFQTLDGVYQRLEEVTPDRIRRLLEEHKDTAYLSKELAVLQEELPLDQLATPIDPEHLSLKPWDWKIINETFQSFEFRTLLQKLAALKPQIDQAVEDVTELPAIEKLTPGDVINWHESLSGDTIYIESAPQLAPLTFMQNQNIWQLDWEPSLLPEPALEGFLESPHPKAFAESKKIRHMLAYYGYEVKGLAFDASLAGYLSQPSHPAYSLEALAGRHLGKDLSTESNQTPEGLALRCKALFDLQSALSKELQEKGLTDLFEQIELPLAEVLFRMERVGVAVDADHLRTFAHLIGTEITSTEQQIFRLAGEEINLNSTKQLQVLLFTTLGLKSRKKTKTGMATDASVLAEMANEHPAIPLILKHRELSKLKSTYLDGMLGLINPATGRIHTTFNQTATATGRLASTNPNLQNIPIKSALGQEIRRAFICGIEGGKIISADYSQIELRILAHLSGDVRLKEAFARGEDIHAKTAAKIFDVSESEVTSAMRRNAKAVNFGIVYGISAQGLADQLGVRQEEARVYIDRYFEEHAQIKEYIDNTVSQAYQDGFVTTLLGRRRYLPELESGNYRIKSYGERLAVNTPIQGSAADIIKIAMIRLDEALASSKSRMVLQVHDELVVEAPAELLSETSALLKKTMENAFPLDPHLEVSVKAGSNWMDATPSEIIS